jgi:hypothetical protein
LRDFIRLLISISILMGGLFGLLLLSPPYIGVLFKMLATLNQIDPLLGSAIGVLLLSGIFWFLSNYRKVLDALLVGIYAMVACVF